MPPSQIAAGSTPTYRADEETPPAETYTRIGRLSGDISRARRIESEQALALPIWVHVLVLAAVGFVTFYIARGLWGWTYDDVFIIHRYARNFANGLGMVYNPGEAYLGTSSVGYTMLLAAMSLVLRGIDFLVLGSIISAVGAFATGALLWFLGVQTRTPLAGALSALLAISNPVIVELWGGEMYLLVPLVLATVLSYSRGRYVLTGVLLGLAVLTRQDSLVLAGVIGAHYLLTKRKLPVAPALAFVLVLLPWTAYSWAFFGSPVPGTLEAKIAQGKAGWPFFLSGSIQWLSDRLGPGPVRLPTLLLIPLGAVALLAGLRRKRVGPWFLFLAWCALFTVGYTLLRVSFYSWYAVPLTIGLCVLIAWGVAGLVELLASILAGLLARARRTDSMWPRAAHIIAFVAAVPVVFLMADRTRVFADNYITYHRSSGLYERVGRWLREQGGPAVSAAYLEVGEIGYYSDSRVVDLLGLVTPGAAAHVPAWDYGWAVQRYRPDYYLANSRFNGLIQNIQEESWFTAAYERAATFDDRLNLPVAQTQQMVVYKRKPGALLPPPLYPVAAQRVSQQPLWFKSAKPTVRIGQTFTVSRPNLAAIALLVGLPAEADTGRMVLHLRDSPAGTEDLRQASVPLSELVNNAWYTFRFDPIPDSAGRSYSFTVELAGTLPGQPPPALWIATDDLYPDGMRYAGTEPAPGDLCMRVSVLDQP